MRMTFLTRWCVSTVISIIAFFANPGIVTATLYHAFMIAVIIGLVNASIPYIIGMVAFTNSLVTLILFTLVLNAFLLYLIERLGLGITFDSLQTTVLAAGAVSIATWFMSMSIDESQPNKKIII